MEGEKISIIIEGGDYTGLSERIIKMINKETNKLVMVTIEKIVIV